MVVEDLEVRSDTEQCVWKRHFQGGDGCTSGTGEKNPECGSCESAGRMSHQ